MWEHGNVVDFLVYEPGQKAHFSVFDKAGPLGCFLERWCQDRFSKDDLLGTARGVLLEPYLDAKTPQDFVLPLSQQGFPL